VNRRYEHRQEKKASNKTLSMASHIVRLAPPRTQPPSRAAALLRSSEPPARVQFWQGASGRRYRHKVYSLRDCPPQPQAVYLLIRRDRDGASTVLSIQSALSDAPTLNLAQIRQHGATLGATEVHVHTLPRGAEHDRTIVCDLRAGQFGSLAATPLDVSRA